MAANPTRGSEEWRARVSRGVRRSVEVRNQRLRVMPKDPDDEAPPAGPCMRVRDSSSVVVDSALNSGSCCRRRCGCDVAVAREREWGRALAETANVPANRSPVWSCSSPSVSPPASPPWRGGCGGAERVASASDAEPPESRGPQAAGARHTRLSVALTKPACARSGATLKRPRPVEGGLGRAGCGSAPQARLRPGLLNSETPRFPS